MSSILIYQDYVYNNGALFKALSSFYGSNQIGFADADDLRNGILDQNVKAFIMPGGASRYVSNKLNGVGNQRIKDYVSQGGLYVGICAGAYYGCNHIQWQPEFGPPITAENELGFFPGTAQGPVPEFISDENSKYMAALTSIKTDDGKTLKAFYWAGPLFVDAISNDYTILATYQDLDGQPPAVITGTFGKGRYLLSSPHLEMDTAQLQRMQFDVIDNRYEDIFKLEDVQGLTHDYLLSLLNPFIDK